MDAFRYSFGWNTWRNPNLLSFNVFEEKPWFIPSDEILQERVCSFLCIKSVKIRTRSVIGEFVGDPSSQFPYFSELFERTNDGRMVHMEVFDQLSGSQRLPKVPGRRNLMVDLLICEVCIARFELLEAFFNLAFTDGPLVKKFVEIAKWLCCIPTFLEVVEQNMANMDIIFDTHFH